MGCNFWERDTPDADGILLHNLEKEIEKIVCQQTWTIICAKRRKEAIRSLKAKQTWVNC